MWREGDGSRFTMDTSVTAAYICDQCEDLSGGFSATFLEIGTFCGCVSLQHVRLPKSLRRIGGRAFHGCTSLLDISLPERTVSLGEHAFFNCVKLTELQLPQSLLHISERAFAHCKSLRKVYFPASLRTLAKEAFESCASLSDVDLSGATALSEIGAGCFRQCTSLTVVHLPPSLIAIGNDAFYGCSGLAKVAIPSSVNTIGCRAFYSCDHSLNLDVPEALQSVGQGSGHLEVGSLGEKIRLPPSFGMLSSRGNIDGLLSGVAEVTISSRCANVGLLIYHVKKKEKYGFLKIKVLYSGPTSTSAAPPPLTEHIPEPFFHFDLTSSRLFSRLLRNGGRDTLHTHVQSAFMAKLSLYASILESCEIASLPVAVLYEILPFIHGGGYLTEPVLNCIVSEVAKLATQKGEGKAQERRLQRREISWEKKRKIRRK